MLAHEEVRARVESALQQVPEPYRTALLLRDIEGLAYEEIAEVLKVSTISIYRDMRFATAFLAQQLKSA